MGDELDDNGYSKPDVKLLTKLVRLEEQMYSLNGKINDIHSGFKSQWDKLDKHGVEIAALKTKASMMGTVGGIVASMVITFFGKLMGRD